MSNSQVCLVFFHIPKTGGSTISRLLARTFPKSATYPFRRDWEADWNCLASQTSEHRNEWQVITGHMPFGVHELLPKRTRYFTVLREPVARVISTHRYSLGVPGPHREWTIPGSEGLRLMLKRKLNLGLDNTQTRYLSGIPDALPITRDDAVIGPGVGFGECTPAMLERAKQNLEQHFDVVGVLERFDETFALLKHEYQWPCWTYHRANVSRTERYPVTPELRELIVESNALDIQLYEFAQRLFDRQIAKFTSIESTIRWHRRLQKMRRYWDRVMRPAEQKLRKLIRGTRPNLDLHRAACLPDASHRVAQGQSTDLAAPTGQG